MAGNASLEIKNLDMFAKLARKATKVNVKDNFTRALRELSFLAERSQKEALTRGPTRAIDTGFLRASVRINSFSSDRAMIGPNVRYSIFVHEGTRFMKARPFIDVGWKNAHFEAQAIMNNLGVRIASNFIIK